MPLFMRLLLTVSIFALAATDHAMAAEETSRYNQIHFQVERSRPVENDRIQAVLSVTAELDSKPLASDPNRG